MIIILNIGQSAEKRESPRNNSNPEPYDICIEDEYIKVSELLKVSVKTLKEEKKRWTEIHRNPIKDKVEVKSEDKSTYVSVRIDTQISNMVNSQPITRVYTIGRPTQKLFSTSIDFAILAMYSIADGLRPAVSIGYRPLSNLNSFEILKNIGGGIYTNLYSAGGSVYYLPTVYISFHIMVGYSLKVEGVSYGVGIGAHF